MAWNIWWKIAISFNLDKIVSHVLCCPGVVSSELGYVFPVVVRRRDKIHGIDLGRASHCAATGIINSESAQALTMIFFETGIEVAYGSASAGGSRPT